MFAAQVGPCLANGRMFVAVMDQLNRRGAAEQLGCFRPVVERLAGCGLLYQHHGHGPMLGPGEGNLQICRLFEPAKCIGRTLEQSVEAS